MKKLLVLIACFGFVISNSGQSNFVKNVDLTTILIKHRKDVDKNEIAKFHANQGGEVRRFKKLDWSIVKFKDKKQADESKKNYEKSLLFEKVSYSKTVKVDDTIPNDTQFTNQWGPIKIQAPLAWDKYTNNDNIVIAVIDTGIDFNHEDIRPNLWTGINGEHGYSAFGGVIREGGQDDHFHGTHVAGTIGAVANNALGVAGLNWRCKLIALKFLNNSGSGTDFDGALLIEHMVTLKQEFGVNIKVSNNSWGGAGPDALLEDAFRFASDAGIMNVCAAGNSGTDNDVFPFSPSTSDLDGIISVLASDINDNKAIFSNFGASTTDLFAPGVNILSCKLGGGYWYLSGTSMASPHVAGVVAMMFAVNPTITIFQCRSILLAPESLDHVSFTENSTFGGRLNMAKVLNNPRLHDTSIPNTNKPPVLTLSESTNFIRVIPGLVKPVIATATDENNDALLYSSQTAGRHENYSLFRNTFSGHLSFKSATNIIIITNKPLARELAIRETFRVSDQHGGVDLEALTLFLQRDEKQIRDLSKAIKGLNLNLDTGDSNIAKVTLVMDNSLIPNDEVKFFMRHAVLGGAYWFENSIPNQTLNVFKIPGLNMLHAHVCDTRGNFYDVPPTNFIIGSKSYTPLYSRTTLSTIRGPAPLEILVDMSASNIGGTNELYYFADKWFSFGEDFDFTNPKKKLILSDVGLYAYQFSAWDGPNNITDDYVALITVLPAGDVVEPPPSTNPPPPTVNLVAPQNLRAALVAGKINLSWIDSSVGEDRIELEYQTKGRSGPWTSWQSLARLAPNTTFFSFTKNPSIARYRFRAKSCKENTCSEYSVVVELR